MASTFQFALLAFSALVVIVDPLGVVPLFIVLTPGATAGRRRAMARRACLIAWALLTIFAVAGSAIFNLLGITLSAFKVAGGLLLLLTAVDQLRGSPGPTRTTDEEQAEGLAKEDISITPLAIPLLAGPGSIATVMMLMGRAQRVLHMGLVLGAITATLVICYLALVFGERIARLLGTTGMHIAERLGGLVLAAIAVQFMLDGVLEALRRT